MHALFRIKSVFTGLISISLLLSRSKNNYGIKWQKPNMCFVSSHSSKWLLTALSLYVHACWRVLQWKVLAVLPTKLSEHPGRKKSWAIFDWHSSEVLSLVLQKNSIFVTSYIGFKTVGGSFRQLGFILLIQDLIKETRVSL